MKNILLYRLYILNVIAAAWLIGTNYNSGWFTRLLNQDTTHAGYVSMALFGTMLIATIFYSWKINKLRNSETRSTIKAGGLEWALKTQNVNVSQFHFIRESVDWMMTIGLIATVMGMMFALDAVDLGKLSSFAGVQSVMAQMIAGVRIELAATITSSIFALWTWVNYTIMTKAQ